MTTHAPMPTIALPAAAETAGEVARGWYLYGITRQDALAGILAEAGSLASPGDAVPLQTLECAGLAALVRPVPLAEFTPAALEERVRSASALEAMVRSHNGVIEAVHARQAILPARFGTVYADADAILSALDAACDALVEQLHRLDGCDEWALHLYADHAVVRERAAARAPGIERLRAECSAARPGRAYFLERQIRDELYAATGKLLTSIADDAFDRLARVAVAGQVNAIGAAAENAGETEILRAAFLVARDAVERFDATLCSIVDGGEGLRCECTGPWPPYSFAFDGAEEAP